MSDNMCMRSIASGVICGKFAQFFLNIFHCYCSLQISIDTCFFWSKIKSTFIAATHISIWNFIIAFICLSPQNVCARFSIWYSFVRRVHTMAGHNPLNATIQFVGGRRLKCIIPLKSGVGRSLMAFFRVCAYF